MVAEIDKTYKEGTFDKKLTIKDMKDSIKDLPDEMIIGGCGNFGELTECYYFGVTEVENNGENITIFRIRMEEIENID